jgi:hypothetical protein
MASYGHGGRPAGARRAHSGQPPGAGGGDLEGLLRGLRLSEAEKSGVKGSWQSEEQVGARVPQAVGRLFSTKPAHVEGMVQTLGRIWCPSSGIRIKELGDNLFLFSFLQPGGKRRAITDGPWDFGGDLLILVDFDSSKRLKDIEFNYTSVWIRAFNLPLGMMNKETGRQIGDRVGKMVEVDTDAYGSAVGSYLRIKVRVDIHKPLLRGVTLEDEEEEEGGFCPLQYEFLPNFCYGCGLLGHVEKDCDENIGRMGEKQFGNWMRASSPKRRTPVEHKNRWTDSERKQRGFESWRHLSGREPERTISGSCRESSPHDEEPQIEGTCHLKDQEKWQRGGVEGEGGPRGMKQGTKLSAVRDANEEVGEERNEGRIGEEELQLGIKVNQDDKGGNNTIQKAAEKEKSEGKMEVDGDGPNLIAQADDQELRHDKKTLAKMQKGKKRTGTYRKIPRISQRQVENVSMASGKKRLLVVGDDSDIVYQKRRKEMVVGVGEGELDNMLVEAGLQEQFRQNQ